MKRLARQKEALEGSDIRESRDKACLVRTGRANNAEAFIEIWTQKEAVFKLLGTGITQEIKDILTKYDGNLYTWKFGDKVLTVATRKELA